MTRKTQDQAVLLAELSAERDRLEAAIENLIAAMAEAPEDARRAGDWAPDGASTRRYLELTNRQGDVERDIADLMRDMAAAAPETRPN